MTSFCVPDGPGRFLSAASTTGPWGTTSQHGGPPAALLARAVEALPRSGVDRVVGRFTMELLGPVPVEPLRVEASVVRPGRSVEMCEALLIDETYDAGSRPCARATAWLFPATGEGPAEDGPALPHTPRDGVVNPGPGSWTGGYLDAAEWRWVVGAVTEPGPGTVWMRPTPDLVEGEPTLGSGSVGLATSRVHDSRGLVARSAQALLVTPSLVLTVAEPSRRPRRRPPGIAVAPPRLSGYS